MRKLVALLPAIAVFSWLPHNVAAQTWPNRTVRIVVGQTPGTTPDLIARMIAEPLSQAWEQPVVVENRSGVGGTIGADFVAKALPDGYTLLVGGQSNLAAAAALDSSLRYDPLKDFTLIARVALVPFFVVANSAVHARTMPELVAAARAHPGRYTFISFGDGTASRLTFQLLMAAADVELVEVPYKGSAPALADLLAGRVDVGVYSLASVRQHIAAGTLRLLAATGSTRAAAAPDVPTIAEQGFTGNVLDAWYGLVAPAGLPADVRARLGETLDRVLRAPDIRKRMEQLDYEPIFDDPARFAEAIRSNIELYSRATRHAGGSAVR
jgi:tripartite-type tricarboxylate transporter receptor subunit TctC